MNKLIIVSILGCFVLIGTFVYFYYSEKEVVDTFDTKYIKSIESKDIQTEEETVKDYDRIIEINYDNRREDCVITKCTSAGCVC